MRVFLEYACVVLTVACGPHGTSAKDASHLRLVPFPKQVDLRDGTYSLHRESTLEAPAAVADFLAGMICAELQRVGLPVPQVRPVESDVLLLRLSATQGLSEHAPPSRVGATPEDYSLQVGPDAVVCAAPGQVSVSHSAASRPASTSC